MSSQERPVLETQFCDFFKSCSTSTVDSTGATQSCSSALVVSNSECKQQYCGLSVVFGCLCGRVLICSLLFQACSFCIVGVIVCSVKLYPAGTE